MAYSSEHPALAAMELLAYWSNYPSMHGYRLFSTEIDAADIEEVMPSLDPLDYSQTRPYGDRWVREQRSFVLLVPSVVVPQSRNYLLNPAHPRMASFIYQDHGAFEYDTRVQALLSAVQGDRR